MKNKMILLLLLIALWQERIFAQDIVQYEYWFDNAFANRTIVNVGAASGLNLSASVNVASLMPGYHRFNYRVKSNDGKWSVPVSSVFANGHNHIVGYAYWFDDNISTMQYIPVNALLGGSFINQINITGLSVGNHKIGIMLKDSMGSWSVPVSDVFYYDGSINSISNQEENIVSIYPNPAKMQITISGVKEYTDLKVTDAAGRIVRQMPLSTDVYLMNIASLTPGIYQGTLSNKTKTAVFSFIRIE